MSLKYEASEFVWDEHELLWEITSIVEMSERFISLEGGLQYLKIKMTFLNLLFILEFS